LLILRASLRHCDLPFPQSGGQLLFDLIQQSQDRGGLKQQLESPQDSLVAGADECREIPHRLRQRSKPTRTQVFALAGLAGVNFGPPVQKIGTDFFTGPGAPVSPPSPAAHRA
jgi:hypothetical protein